MRARVWPFGHATRWLRKEKVGDDVSRGTIHISGEGVAAETGLQEPKTLWAPSRLRSHSGAAAAGAPCTTTTAAARRRKRERGEGLAR